MGYPSPEKLNLLKHKINLRHNPDSSAIWALQLSFSIHDKALITIRRNAAKYIYIYIQCSFLDKAVLNGKKNPNTLGKPFEYNASRGIFKTIYAFHKLSSYLLPALLFTLLRTFYITNALSSLFFLINPFNGKKRA